MTGAMVRLTPSEREQYERWAAEHGITTWQQMCRSLMTLGYAASTGKSVRRPRPGNASGRHVA